MPRVAMMPGRWLAAVCAALPWAVSIAQPMVPLQLQCSGREPEWRLEAGPDSATLVRADARPASETFRGTLMRLVTPTWDGAAWRGVAVAAPSASTGGSASPAGSGADFGTGVGTGPRPGGLPAGASPSRPLAAVVKRETCVDPSLGGVPTEARGAVVPPDGPPLAGCCRATFGFDLGRAPLADPSRKDASDWSKALPALAGAVRACVIDSGVPVAAVASAAALESGGASVRLIDVRGAVHECEVDRSRRRVVATRAASPGAELTPTAGSPVLWPAREQSPLIACGRVERVVERGRPFGWLHYGPC